MTSGIIFPANDPTIFQFNMPPASATCGGCPNGLTEVEFALVPFYHSHIIKSCYPTQGSSDPAQDIADISTQCPSFANFCACPSNGQPCFTFGQATAVTDVQIYSFCDAGGGGFLHLYLHPKHHFKFASAIWSSSPTATLTSSQTEFKRSLSLGKPME